LAATPVIRRFACARGEARCWSLPKQHNAAMSLAKTWTALAMLGLGACSPTLNWREVPTEDGQLLALFPCKPDRLQRTVPLAGAPSLMRLASCSVDGVTYALSDAGVAEPAKVGAALQQLRVTAAGNIGAAEAAGTPVSVAGMTPNPQAKRVALQGRGADGQPVHEQLAVFAKGLRVYQATVIGPTLDAEPVEMFFAGLRFPG
jgi:hypothetical protein